MMWQDIVLMICNLVMGYALVPQIFYNFKNKKSGISVQTSLLTFIALFVASYIYFIINLFFTFVLTVVIGIFWLVFFIQAIVYKK